MTYRPGGFDILADSLKNQTMKNYELIIVDDYPIDRKDIVKRYLEGKGIPVAYVGPSKPKCFPELPFNVFNAMNTGLLLSTKEVVVILQDYQWLPPDCLEKFAQRYDLFKDNYCVVLPGQMWEQPRPRDNEGLISIWSQPWKGSPEENGCQKSFIWVPEGWEFACIAYPWSVVAKMNGFPECLDAFAAHPLEPFVMKLEAAGGKPYVDKGNFLQMINHREWLPLEMWHQAKRTGSAVYIERENCFDLKNHVRGKAY